MSKTFPMLKVLAAQRNVALTEVDLRWGISHEEAESGCIVDVCLKEIENSIPFFIGIIGERYGWCPSKEDVKNTVLTNEKYKWIYDDVDAGLSITEMEMQYGVLRRKEDINAFFYIKDHQKEDENEKLIHLKSEVRNNHHRYPVHDYSSIEQLAKQVEEDFRQLLDEVFPQEEISASALEKISQRSYVRSLSKNYVPDGKSFKVLDDFINSRDQQFLVITGKSGLGKSALMANWVKNQKQGNIISLFIGNGGSNGNYQHILNFLRDEFFELTNLTDERKEQIKGITDSKKQLAELWSEISTNNEKYVVVIDAINQIENYDDAKLLNWLPNPPANIKMMFSTLEDDATMNVFKIREHHIYTLQPLGREQRKKLIISYLSSFGKKLSNKQIDNIIDNGQSENTLALRTLLDELIRFGHYDLLDKRIAYYMSASSLEEFYQFLLTQYECDYGNELVKNILGLIATSHYGMQEDEIQQILSLRQLDWSQFFCAFSSHLISKNGLINFSHNYVRDAVTAKYIVNDNTFEYKCHQLISDFFEDVVSVRSMQERCFQYDKLEEYKKLSDLLLHYDIIDYMFQNDEFELGRYIRILPEKTNGEFDLERMLYPDESMTDDEMLYNYNTLCKITMGLVTLPHLATKFGKAMVELYDIHPEWEKDWRLFITYSNLANASKLSGNIADASIFFNKLIALINPNTPEYFGYLSSAYSDMGDMYAQDGYYEKSIEYQNNALEICYKMFPLEEYQIGIIERSLAMVFIQIGKFENAEKHLFNAHERLIRCCGKDSEDVASVDLFMGNLYIIWGLYEQAGIYLKRALPLLEFYYGENHITTAMLYHLLSNYYYLYREAEQSKIFAEKSVNSYKAVGGNNYFELVKCYAQLGSSYALCSEYEKAEEAFFEGIRVSNVSLVDNPLTGILHNNFGLYYNEIEQYNKAIEQFTKAIENYDRVTSELYPHKIMAINNIGLAYYNLGNLDEAEINFNKSYNMAHDLYGDKNPNTLTMMNNCSLIMLEKEEYEKAYKLLKNTYALRREIFEEENIDDVLVLNNIASSLGNLGNTEDAINYYNHALSLLRKCNGEDHPLNFRIINNIGQLYYENKNYNEALKHLLIALDFQTTHFGEDNEDWGSLFDQLADCYFAMGNYKAATEYYQKELDWRLKYKPKNEKRIERCKKDLTRAKEKM